MKKETELRARLAEVSIDDLDAVHDLYLDTRKFLSHGGRIGVGETLGLAELSRRVERAEGLAIRAAQSRGELLRQGQSNRVPGVKFVSSYISSAGETTRLYRMVDGISDEVFEKAIEWCKAEGSLARPALTNALRKLAVSPVIEPPAKVLPTKRGRKTVEHMAIQLNALAMGVADLDPAEVDKTLMAPMVNQAFEDIGAIRAFLRKVNKQ